MDRRQAAWRDATECQRLVTAIRDCLDPMPSEAAIWEAAIVFNRTRPEKLAATLSWLEYEACATGVLPRR